MEQREVVVSSERIFDGKIIQVRVDTIETADGRRAKREIVQHLGAVCIVPVRDDGVVLLVRQFRLAAGSALLEAPAGKLEEGEEPALCAARELQEETGFAATELTLLFSAFLSPGFCTEEIHAYLATGLKAATANPDEGENLDLVTMPFEDAERLALSGEMCDAKTIAALAAAGHVLRERAKQKAGDG